MASLDRQLSELGKRLNPRSSWVEDLRQSLFARGHARRSYVGVGRFALHLPMLFPRISSTVGAVFMLVLGVSVSVSAAKESLPGNRFYSLKRTIERVELKTASVSEKPQVQISQATRRLKEAGVLAVTTPNSPKIKESLTEFTTQLNATALQIDKPENTPAERQAIAQSIVDTASTYARVLSATKVVVAPPLAREALQAKHLVNLSTVKAVETLVDAKAGVGATGVVSVDEALKASIKDQVASLKIDAKEATDLIQSGSNKKADPSDADAKVRIDLTAKAAESIGTAEYLVEKGDYRQAAAKIRQTLEFMVQLDAAAVLSDTPAKIVPATDTKTGGIQLEVDAKNIAPVTVPPAK